MTDHTNQTNSADQSGADPTARLVQMLVDQWAAERAARDRFEQQALAFIERIALALERGATGLSGLTGDGTASARPVDGDQAFAAEVRGAIDERRWDRAQAILDARGSGGNPDALVESLVIELNRARDRAIADLTDRIEAARQTNDAAGALIARDELARTLGGDDLKAVDHSLVRWLMKLIQRRLRSIPVGTDLVMLATEVANRFGGTTEGASLRAALPTLRRSAGLCPRCAEPYLGVDDACPQCLADAGQTPAPAPTLTFVTDDLDSIVADSTPIDLNNAEIWQLP